MNVRHRSLGIVALVLGVFLVVESSGGGATLPPNAGRIYIVGYPNQIAQIEDMKGTGWRALGSEGPGINQFKFPRGIFVDKLGQIYVADSSNHRIVQMRDITGTRWNSLGGFSPTGIFVDEEGRIYVADWGYDRIVRINDMSGIGNQMILSGFSPSGIFVDMAGRIYVTDSSNDRVVRFDDMTGAGRITLGMTGAGIKQFDHPQGIFVDKKGRIYVADFLNHRIVRMSDMTGAGWTTLGSCPQPPRCTEVNQFLGPAGIFVDEADRIYVADANNGRIVRVNDMTGAGWIALVMLGRQLGEIGTLWYPEGIFVR